MIKLLLHIAAKMIAYSDCVPPTLIATPNVQHADLKDSDARLAAAKIAGQIKDIYNFSISIGAAEAADFSFITEDLPTLEALGYGSGVSYFFKQLPVPTRPFYLHPKAQAISQYNEFEFTGVDGSRQIPLTRYRPSESGWRIIFDANRGKVDLEMPVGMITRDASMFFRHIQTALNDLTYIPIKHWVDVDNVAFVTEANRIYSDVKEALTEVYGWPEAFRREDWIRDLPGLVEVWREKDASLEKADKDAEVDIEPEDLTMDDQQQDLQALVSVLGFPQNDEKHNRVADWVDDVNNAESQQRMADVEAWLGNVQLNE